MEHFKKLIKNKAMHEAMLFLMMSIGLLIHALTKHYAQSMPDWKMSPYLFPLLVSFFLFLLSISMLADARRTLKISEEEKQEKVSPQPIYWKKILMVIILSIAYYTIMPLITFIPSTILFLVLMFLYLGERRPLIISLISVLTAGTLYALFAMGLNVMLP